MVGNQTSVVYCVRIKKKNLFSYSSIEESVPPPPPSPPTDVLPPNTVCTVQNNKLSTMGVATHNMYIQANPYPPFLPHQRNIHVTCPPTPAGCRSPANSRTASQYSFGLCVSQTTYSWTKPSKFPQHSHSTPTPHIHTFWAISILTYHHFTFDLSVILNPYHLQLLHILFALFQKYSHPMLQCVFLFGIWYVLPIVTCYGCASLCSPQECPGYKVYRECASACPPSCFRSEEVACIAVCLPGTEQNRMCSLCDM